MCVFVAAGTCLPIRCLETGSTTPFFIRLLHSNGCTRYNMKHKIHCEQNKEFLDVKGGGSLLCIKGYFRIRQNTVNFLIDRTIMKPVKNDCAPMSQLFRYVEVVASAFLVQPLFPAIHKKRVPDPTALTGFETIFTTF
jgi:hypothetical protein